MRSIRAREAFLVGILADLAFLPCLIPIHVNSYRHRCKGHTILGRLSAFAFSPQLENSSARLSGWLTRNSIARSIQRLFWAQDMLGFFSFPFRATEDVQQAVSSDLTERVWRRDKGTRDRPSRR